MYLTNNVLRRELEHIAEQPRVPMTTRSAWTTQNILFWGEGTRPADAERHEQIFGRARPGRFDSDAMPMSSNTYRYVAPATSGSAPQKGTVQ